MLDEMQSDSGIRQNLSLSRMMAFFISAVVYAVSLLFLLLSVVFFWKSTENFVLIVHGIFCLSIFFLFRPVVIPLPERTLRRQDYPVLFGVIDKLQAALKAPPIDNVVMDASFNAGFAHTGWRGKRTLFLGYPLLHLCTTGEKIAIIAHELAHQVNNDPVRIRFVGSAIATLNRWYQVMNDHSWLNTHSDTFLPTALTRWGGLIASWIMKGLSVVPFVLVHILSHLLWHDSQRAEYLADRLAATVAGRDNLISALHKLHYWPVVDQCVQQSVARNDKSPMWDRLDENIKNLPEHELLRLKRLISKETASLDSTHPPDGFRIAALQFLPLTTASVLVSQSEAGALEDELHRFKSTVEEALRDEYTRALYY